MRFSEPGGSRRGCGLHDNTVCRVERGELSPSVDAVVLGCAAMGYKLWQLFLETGEMVGKLGGGYPFQR